MRLVVQMCLLACLLIAIGVTALPLRRTAAPPLEPAIVEIKIDNFTFAPPQVKVAVGTEVIWINRDDIPHTVVSTDGAFKSGVLDTDDKFSYRFAKAGTYRYFCSVHPKMTGQILVE
jgi:plastocyanin